MKKKWEAHEVQLRQEIDQVDSMMTEYEMAGATSTKEYIEVVGYKKGLERALTILQIYGMARRETRK